MFDIEEHDDNPDVTAYLAERYEMQRGRGGLSIRKRPPAAARGFFSSKKGSDEPFERLSAYWPVVLLDVQQNLRPVPKAAVVQAAHRVCELQELAILRARKESR